MRQFPSFSLNSTSSILLSSTVSISNTTIPSTVSPSAGDIIALKDYAETFDNNNVTVGRNSSKIGGRCLDATLNTQGDSITLVYVDATQGWLLTEL